ncbi:MAG: murein biosynthesis integral membrane protein MurJ [Thomasclavelia ramosa]
MKRNKIQTFSNARKASQLILMIVLTCCAQAVALYKSRFMATNFGATQTMDAYNYATNIATFIFSFITSGITTVIIPAYIKEKNSKSVNTFITVIFAGVLLIVGGVLVFRYPIIDLLTTKDSQYIQYICSFLFSCFLIQGIISFLNVTTAYYQCENYYLIPKVVLLICNIIVVIVLYVGNIKDIQEYLLVLIMGSVINLIVDVGIAMGLGFRYKPCFDLRLEDTKKLFIIFFPTLFSSGVYKINSLVDSMIASSLKDGQLTILTFSTQVITMVNTLVIGNLTVYAYPLIVSRLGQKEEKKQFWDYAVCFHCVVCLLIAGCFTVGYEGLSLIFGGGEFQNDQVKLLYICVCVYIFGQQTNIVRDLVYRYFYANGDTKITLRNSIVISIENIILSLILVKFLGLLGIILGTILSSATSLVMIVKKFKQKYGLGVRLEFIFRECIKTCLIMVITIVFVLVIKNICDIESKIISLLFFGIMTVVVYIVLLKILKSNVWNTKF